MLQIDLHLAAGKDLDTGKTLLHLAASSGALFTIEVSALHAKYICHV